MPDNDALIDFVSTVSGEAFLRVEESLGDGFVRLRIAEAERRQAKHDIRSVEDVIVELLRNSRDAHAQRIFVSSAREGELRTITIIDDGVGVPAHLHEAIFEPRVTSKLETMVMDRWGVHGRGMALFSVRSNVAVAQIASSDVHKGAAMTVVADTTELSERADQSTWPTVERTESGQLAVARGPHNIIRRVVEFACEHPELEVYLGSPTEVLSTLHEVARCHLDTADLMFCDDLSKMTVWHRPAACSDALELVETAEKIGLPVSERTAHRIIGGELPVLEPVLAEVMAEDDRPAASEPDIYRDRRSLRIHHTDLASFKHELERAFDTLAERYYLNLRGEPKISIGADEIRVRFAVDKDE
ncbi:MAG: sensor histidine kinase [Coriobacteriia bacterium]|nr:sensor histidine kinase [Coriobacteriia bacterium]MBN2821852.1 sensor histidine kinase [Coriobacteriia bacterium]